MGLYLDLSDVAAGNPVAESQLADLLRAQKRYETVRTLNVEQFRRLYAQNICGDGRFDELVDRLGMTDAG